MEGAALVWLGGVLVSIPWGHRGADSVNDAGEVGEAAVVQGGTSTW
jgi:hypothetical protein